MSATQIAKVGGVPAFLTKEGKQERVHFVSGATIDADGSPRAYHPLDRPGLDDLANAGHPGNWWGIATRNGKPFVQSTGDPAPGFYVSTTALQRPGFKVSDTRRYIDSELVPFIVVPNQFRRIVKGTVLGCLAEVEYNGKTVQAVVADVGPADHLGELSIAAAKAVGIPANARKGGVESRVTYRFWPGVPATINGETFRLVPL